MTIQRKQQENMARLLEKASGFSPQHIPQNGEQTKGIVIFLEDIGCIRSKVFTETLRWLGDNKQQVAFLGTETWPKLSIFFGHAELASSLLFILDNYIDGLEGQEIAGVIQEHLPEAEILIFTSKPEGIQKEGLTVVEKSDIEHLRAKVEGFVARLLIHTPTPEHEDRSPTR